MQKKAFIGKLRKTALVLMFTVFMTMTFTSMFAAETQNGSDLIGTLCSLTKDDPKIRISILKIITNQEELVTPLKMQTITDGNVGTIANKIIKQLSNAELDKASLEKSLKEFYAYQQKNEEMASLILEKYQNGYVMHDDKYLQAGGFDGIKKVIEEEFYSYLIFLNYLRDAEEFYNIPREMKIYNLLYVDEAGKIQLYPDLEELWKTPDEYYFEKRIPDYVERMEKILTIVNGDTYKEERKNFIANLKIFRFIDDKKRPVDGYDPDDINKLFPDEENEVVFNDLDTVPWAAEYINALAKKGIISGVAEGIFAPNNNVTREEFAKMLVSAFGFSDDTARTQLTDVSPDAWYYPYVSVAEKLGIVKGNGTEFGVGQNITRQDMAVMAYRAAQKANVSIKKVKEAQAFADEAEIADYARESVTAMQQADIINGVEGNRFAPNENATRAQAAKIIYLLIQE